MTSARFILWAAFLSAPLAACARQSAPPGGPPDNVPPIVVSTTPDTFALVEPFDDPVRIRFNERISERPSQGGSLDEAVVVSPATSAVEVEHGRRELEISLVQGFEEGRVYRVRVMPVIQDLFDNPMISPFELVFSTGPDVSPGVVAGIVRDRITGEPVNGGRVHATGVERGDSVVYVGRTDADGIYALRYLPPGPYEVTAFRDQNRSGAVDETEPRASEAVVLTGPADTLVVPLEVLAPDTTPARLAGVEAVDSASILIETDDFLDPSDSLASVRVSLSREVGAAPATDSLLRAYQWDARSRLLEQRAAAAAAAAADTVAAAQDTLAPDTAAPEPPAGDTAAPDTAAPPETDTLTGPYGAGEPPRAEQALYVVLGGPLEPGVDYRIEVSGIRNIAGVEGGGGVDTLVWEPPPPDTTGAVADTADAPGDTLPPEAEPPDTAGAEPDAAEEPPDTAEVPPDVAEASGGAGAHGSVVVSRIRPLRRAAPPGEAGRSGWREGRDGA